MANPGPYPPMGQMQPMGGPPMGHMAMRPPARQGTSHVVPVVVSAGLAVGVFCGLLFGLGTKKDIEPARASNGAKQSEESQIQTAAVSTGSKPTPGTPAATPGTTTPAAGSAATPAAGSAAAPVAAAPPKPGKLTIDIKPDSAAQVAKVFIDGRQLSGTTADVAFEPGVKEKTVKVVVQAAGFQEEQRDETVKSEENTQLSIPLKPVKAATTNAGGTTGDDGKAGAGGTSTGGTGGGTKSNGTKSGTGKGSGKSNTKGNGLIDI